MCIVCVVPFSIVVNMEGAEGTLYSGEHYRVSFKFTEKYPFDSPGVSFCVCSEREGGEWSGVGIISTLYTHGAL